MAFAGSSTSYTAAGSYMLPLRVDVSGNTDATTLYSHLQSSGGGTIAFDNAPSLVTTIPAVATTLAIPPAARNITLTGAANVILGTMD